MVSDLAPVPNSSILDILVPGLQPRNEYWRLCLSSATRQLKRVAPPPRQDCGWDSIEPIRDLGSGLNYKKKGLQRLIHLILSDRVERLVITHKDRLLRFGSELIFSSCEQLETQFIILKPREDATFEEDIATDVLEIITVFSARLYGSRSRKKLKLMRHLHELPQKNLDAE